MSALPRLLKSAEEAAALIRLQVDKGRTLIEPERLRDTLSSNDERKWVEDTRDLLATLFDGDQFVTEFSRSATPPPGIHPRRIAMANRRDPIGMLLTSINGRLSILQSILDRRVHDVITQHRQDWQREGDFDSARESPDISKSDNAQTYESARIADTLEYCHIEHAPLADSLCLSLVNEGTPPLNGADLTILDCQRWNATRQQFNQNPFKPFPLLQSATVQAQDAVRADQSVAKLSSGRLVIRGKS